MSLWSHFRKIDISLLECCHGVRPVLPYQCSTFGDAAVVRGVGADRSLRMGPVSPSRWMPRPPDYLILSMTV
jgi:hypothetical protein